MKRLIQFLSILTVLFFQEIAYSQSGDENNTNGQTALIEEAKEKLNRGEEEESLKLFKKVLQRDGENLDALWNSAVIYAQKGNRTENEEEKEKYFDKGLELAEKAKSLYEDEGFPYYAYAVVIARKTNILGTREKINASYEIKENIEIAARKLTDFAPVWHLYGVWHSDIANVSGVESAAAGLVSEGVPDASNEKAEEYLLKAVELDRENVLFNFDLAKHYLEVDDREKSIEVLEKVIEMEPMMKDDSKYIKKAKELLQTME